MKKLLLVDDEKDIRELLNKFAAFEGYKTVFAKDGFQAIELAEKENPDLIVLDVMMPHLDGFSAAKEIRQKSQVPIIMLSARGEEYDKLHGFELGIDDYVVKPFSPKELFLRIKAVLHRVYQEDEAKQDEKIELDNLAIDSLAREVFYKNKKLLLTAKEFDLLNYLATNKGTALKRENILNNVWGYDSFQYDRTVDTHIKTLRQKLGKAEKYIETVRGYGYKFNDKV